MQVFRKRRRTHIVAAFFLTMMAAVWSVRAQSIDINSPSPVTTHEIVGRIAARDLGDSRLTDHYYAFVGTPGDVLITIRGTNLNGDVDIFTKGTLRPLLKFSLYAESSSPITKGIYLRKREDLVLRVEARSPNDDEGIYHIRLGGSFEPIVGETFLAAAETPSPESSAVTAAARGKNGRRVSSVGARIAEPPRPPEEVAAAAAPTPEPTPAESPAATATPESAIEKEAPAPSSRRTRGRVPAGRRGAASRPATKEKAGTETENKEKVGEVSEPETTPPSAGRTGKRSVPARAPEQPQEPEPQIGPRLIIEMHDGTRVERFMSAIRRVTVENNQIVVVSKLGRIERIRMSEVIRMAIEP